MKLANFTNLSVACLIAMLAATGCKHKPVNVTPLPNGGHTTVGPGGDDNSGKVPGGSGGPESATPQANPADWANATRNETIFEADTVHFEYDSSVVKSSEKSKVDDVANYLKGHPGTGVEIQGHCDERGTDQYNYALGERRATAIREELISSGVSGNNVLTVSFGRSRPVDTGHSDAAHAKNRRGQFVLLTK